MNGDLFGLLFLPLIIFFARIFDVSLGTIRIILIGKGYRRLAPVLGFLESFVWILAVSQIMKNLNNFFYYLCYGLGYATGTYVGMYLESKLSLGQVIVRVIANIDSDSLIAALLNEGHNLTSVNGEGQFGRVKVIFMVMKRQRLNDAIRVIKNINPNAFYSVEDIRSVNEEAFFFKGGKKSPIPKISQLRK